MILKISDKIKIKTENGHAEGTVTKIVGDIVFFIRHDGTEDFVSIVKVSLLTKLERALK